MFKTQFALTLDWNFYPTFCFQLSIRLIIKAQSNSNSHYFIWIFHRFIDLFSKYEGFKERKLKLKRPKQLQEVLDIAREMLNDIKEDKSVFESHNKLRQLKSVLEM